VNSPHVTRLRPAVLVGKTGSFLFPRAWEGSTASPGQTGLQPREHALLLHPNISPAPAPAPTAAGTRVDPVCRERLLASRWDSGSSLQTSCVPTVVRNLCSLQVKSWPLSPAWYLSRPNLLQTADKKKKRKKKKKKSSSACWPVGNQGQSPLHQLPGSSLLSALQLAVVFLCTRTDNAEAGRRLPSSASLPGRVTQQEQPRKQEKARDDLYYTGSN